MKIEFIPLKVITAVLAVSIIINSCSKEDVAKVEPKSKANSITNFSFTAEGKTYNATVIGSNINVAVPFDLDIEAITPVIQISPQSTIAPASGIAQNLRNPLTYTVTAEDLSQKTYEVKLTRSTQPITIENLAYLQYKIGDYVVLTGSNFGIYKEDNSLSINSSDGSILEIKNFNFDPKTRAISFQLPEVEYPNLYHVRLTVLGTLQQSSQFQLLTGKLILTSALRNIYTPGDFTLFKLRFLEIEKILNKEYNVYIQKDSDPEIEINLVPLLAYNLMQINLPLTPIPTGIYSVLIKDNANTMVLTKSLNIVDLPKPTITSINKLVFSEGEDVVIEGSNFEAPLFGDQTTNFSTRLELSSGGRATVASGPSINPEPNKIRYTIPSGMKGTWNVRVTINNLNGFDYKDQITIQ